MALLASDGSFDSSIVSGPDPWYFVPSQASSYSPTTIGCLDGEAHDIVVTFPQPLPTSLSQDSTHILDYTIGGSVTVNLSPDRMTATMPRLCFNDAQESTTPATYVLQALDTLTLGVTFDFWSAAIPVRSLGITSNNPVSGAAGTVITITGEFDIRGTHTCTFGDASCTSTAGAPSPPTVVTATTISQSQISCVAPALTCNLAYCEQLTIQINGTVNYAHGSAAFTSDTPGGVPSCCTYGGCMPGTTTPCSPSPSPKSCVSTYFHKCAGVAVRPLLAIVLILAVMVAV